MLERWLWFCGRRQPSRDVLSSLASAGLNRATRGNSFTMPGTCSPCRALCVGSWRQPLPYRRGPQVGHWVGRPTCAVVQQRACCSGACAVQCT
eukprot:15473326-Alexandrium_andersonii.AAC.1